jgi:NDP-sugar pyrophosphorylase family protein
MIKDIEKDIEKNFIPIVLCAGFGTRLKPLTDYFPKAVCPIGDKPSAFLHIEQFFKMGFEKVYCNVFYLKEIVMAELKSCAIYFGYDPTRIVFYQEDSILETGGGILNIFEDLKKKDVRNSKKDVIVVSGDIVSSFSFKRMVYAWQNKTEDELALMCVKKTDEPRKDATWFDEGMSRIMGFGGDFISSQSEGSGCVGEHLEKNICHGVFTNHQIISHKVLNETKPSVQSSVHLFYKKILAAHKTIKTIVFREGDSWFDIGTPKAYAECLKIKLGCNNKDNPHFLFNKIHYKNKINLEITKESKEVKLSDFHELEDAIFFVQAFQELKDQEDSWYRLGDSIFYFNKALCCI